MTQETLKGSYPTPTVSINQSTSQLYIVQSNTQLVCEIEGVFVGDPLVHVVLLRIRDSSSSDGGGVTTVDWIPETINKEGCWCGERRRAKAGGESLAHARLSGVGRPKVQGCNISLLHIFYFQR